MICAALGLFLSVPKCQLLALPAGKFLGMIVSAPQSRFEIPADKKEFILQLIKDGLQTTRPIARQLAKTAGVLLSVKEAVYMAPLYTRLLFRAVAAVQGWEALVPKKEGQFAREDLLHWEK